MDAKAWSDEGTTVAQLQEAVRRFISERDWEDYHNPKNLSMSIAIEAAELMEHFQWLTAESSARRMEDPEARAAVADELADVLIYCLSLANECRIDLSRAIQAKLAHNQGRFPVGYMPET